MKASTKKKWLLEWAKWLRAAGAAPATLIAFTWVGNAVLHVAGHKGAFTSPGDLLAANVPTIVLAAVGYMTFNALATYFEIKSEDITEVTEVKVEVVETYRTRRRDILDDSG